MTHDDFVALVKRTWGEPLTVKTTDLLPAMYPQRYDLEPGWRAYVFVGRAVPTHYLLRAFRNLWPDPVESIAILRNTQANPDLDPALMETFEETYVPSVEPDKATATMFARSAAERNPPGKGGFVVRLRSSPSGGPVDAESVYADIYVPLRGLPENSVWDTPRALE